jgi:hypothetical protein
MDDRDRGIVGERDRQRLAPLAAENSDGTGISNNFTSSTSISPS